MKCYKLYFEDKEGNELMQKTIECRNIKEAKKTADLYFANSMLNDLHKIRTKLM